MDGCADGGVLRNNANPHKCFEKFYVVPIFGPQGIMLVNARNATCITDGGRGLHTDSVKPRFAQ